MLNAKVVLQLYGNFVAGRVKQQVLVPEGKIVGRYDANHILSSMIYEVELLDGQVNYYVANVIVENMLSQVDYKVYSVTLVYSIVAYKRKDSAVDKYITYVVTRRGQRRSINMTQGWKLLVAWKDESKTWITLKSM